MSNPPGTVHLVGGGRDEDALSPLIARFVRDAASRRGSETSPRVHALLVLEEDDDESVERFRGLLESAGADVSVHAITEGDVFEVSAIDGADGIFVGGGLTPAYLDAFARIGLHVRDRVASGTPYLGFSAGAAIAAATALVGGYLIDGVIVCDEDAGEELDEVTALPGLGLVPLTVEVHAAQWGTFSRLVAAVGAGLVTAGFAIDEHTAVVWESGDAASEPAVVGQGSAWRVTREGDAALVERRTA